MLSIKIRCSFHLIANSTAKARSPREKSTEQAITDEIRSLGPGKEIKILFRFVMLFMGDQNEKIKKSQYHMTEIHVIALLI